MKNEDVIVGEILESYGDLELFATPGGKILIANDKLPNSFQGPRFSKNPAIVEKENSVYIRAANCRAHYKIVRMSADTYYLELYAGLHKPVRTVYHEEKDSVSG